MRKDRLLKLADYLETLEAGLTAHDRKNIDVGWNFAIVRCLREDHPNLMVEDLFGNVCGTTACALGHLPHVFPGEIAYADNYDAVEKHMQRYMLQVEGELFSAFATAAVFFDISDDNAEMLFNPAYARYAQRQGLPLACHEDATPAMVATNIRAFVALDFPL